MKIKNIIKTLVFIALPLGGVGGGLSSCSNIPEDERLIYVEPASAARNVLIEDFTGQKCVNCPKAGDAIHEILEVYGENVVAVAIHCGPFGGLSAKNPGLMTSTGKEYWNAWFDSTQGQPVAKINRGAATNDYINWAAEVQKCLQQSTDVKISIDRKSNVDTGEATINVTTSAKAGRKAKIQVWLTENNIVATQYMPDGSRNTEYVHQHVFRAAVNGTWGEDITYTESEQHLSWKTTLDPSWDANNVNIVVFVYDENGVEQVAQVPFIYATLFDK